MARPAKDFVLLAATTLVVLGGCKGDRSKTSAEAEGTDPVVLLENGNEPRELLRYAIAPGTTTTSNMDFRLASLAVTPENASLTVVPGVRLHVVSGPAMQSKNGTRYDVRIVKSEALFHDALSEELSLDLQQGASVLNNVGGWVEVDDRGVIQATELNEHARRADIPVRLLVMLVNARTTLARVLLPAEPVGLGARWEARKELTLYGFAIQQVDTYTLVGKVGDELKIDVATQQTALPQQIEFADEGIDIALESFRMNAAGEIITNLNQLSANALASGESVGRLMVTTVNGSEPVEIDRTFELQLQNVPVNP